jgi:hypothetical protein
MGNYMILNYEFLKNWKGVPIFVWSDEHLITLAACRDWKLRSRRENFSVTLGSYLGEVYFELLPVSSKQRNKQSKEYRVSQGERK